MPSATAALDHDQLIFDVQHSPSIRLLRSDSAPLVLSFLHREFKHEQRVTVAYDELVQRLEIYLELLNDRQAGVYPRAASAYLKQWCDEEHRYLRTYTRGGSDEQVAELSADTERALDWVEDLHRHNFIGTESRFLHIFGLLTEIVRMSTVDVDERLAQLEQQQAALQREIDAIRATRQIESYTPTQVKERFLQACDVGRHLLRDFAAVEQNFREIAHAVSEAQYAPDARKGTVVGYVLDADDTLKSSDQGRSFYAFWEFLLSPSKQDELHALLETVYRLPALSEVSPSSQILKYLTRSLIEAGEKIVYSNSRLAEQLRRMLDERTLAEARRARELIAEIKQHAIHLTQDAPQQEEFVSLEGAPEVRLGMERALWEPTTLPNFRTPPSHPQPIELSAFPLASLYSQFVVDESMLRQRVETLLAMRSRVTLAEVVERYPVEQSLAEILAYVALAAKDARHTIDESSAEEIPLNPFLHGDKDDEYDDGDDGGDDSGEEQMTTLTVPQIIFRSRHDDQ